MDFDLENLWLAMKGTRYNQVVERLHKEILSSATLEEALSITLNQVVAAVHAVAGTLWFYDRFGDGMIRPAAVYGGSDLSNIALQPGEGVAGQVVATGESTIIAQCQKDPRWAGRVDEKTGFQTKSMICVPLKWHSFTFGSVQIINKVDNTAYDEKDLLFAQDIALRVADAFEQRGLLREYVAAAAMQAEQEEVIASDLDDLVLEPAFIEVEEKLEKMAFFRELSRSGQKNVLRHMREIWMLCQSLR